MEELRIIFMGTPEFAVAGLEVLVQNKFTVVAVVTAPDKPQGRGQKLISSPVKDAAISLGIPVLQPVNLKAPEFVDELRSFQANLQVVIAFRMLPEVVWSMPAFGTFNLHASLLPQYRGAAPINWALINGEKETGVTTFFLQHVIDTGHIIFQEKEPIHQTDNAGTLYQRLMQLGSRVVLRTVQAIEAGNAISVPQVVPETLKTAPKIFKETCELHWTETAEEICNKVRGLSPYPCAWCILSGKTFKIHATAVADYNKVANAGEWATDGKNYLYICTRQGWVSVLQLQAEGKRKMGIKEFLAGNRLGGENGDL